jgi:hypothetical protein
MLLVIEGVIITRSLGQGSLAAVAANRTKCRCPNALAMRRDFSLFSNYHLV